MTPNSPSNEFLILMLVMGAMSFIGLPIILIEMFETKRRRMRMNQRHTEWQQSHTNTLQNLWREETLRRQELERIVAAQAADHPPVSIPVTNCERRERRRRFLPLEDRPDATS